MKPKRRIVTWRSHPNGSHYPINIESRRSLPSAMKQVTPSAKTKERQSFRSSGFRVVIVPKKIKGYVGMNYYSAKELGIAYPYSMDTILVWKGDRDKESTIRHEKIEFNLMAKGLNYRKAHRIARKYD